MTTREHAKSFWVLVSYNRELDQGPMGSGRNTVDQERGRRSGEWKWVSETEEIKGSGAGQQARVDP